MRYSKDQFATATRSLVSVIRRIPSVIPPPRGGTLDVVCVDSAEGGELLGLSIFQSAAAVVRLNARLQDDGDAPYAVVDLRRQDWPENGHAVTVTTEIKSLYPHQFDRIPALIDWLLRIPQAMPPSSILA